MQQQNQTSGFRPRPPYTPLTESAYERLLIGWVHDNDPARIFKIKAYRNDPPDRKRGNFFIECYELGGFGDSSRRITFGTGLWWKHAIVQTLFDHQEVKGKRWTEAELAELRKWAEARQITEARKEPTLFDPDPQVDQDPSNGADRLNSRRGG